MPESRAGDRTPMHYTMKTSHSARGTHNHSPQTSHHKRSGRASKPSTPIASPRMPFSVGQPYPPKLSPSRQSDVRAPSPNYFGLIVEPAGDPRDSSVVPRENWSPPTSSVKSFAAALPKQVPIDANPDFEAFKRQADLNRGASGFNLGTSHFPTAIQNPSSFRPRAARWNTHASDTASERSIPRPVRDRPLSRMDIDQDANSLHDSAYVSSDSKRNSEASMNPPSFFNLPRFESPRPAESPFERRTTLSRVDDRHPRLSITSTKVDPPSPDPARATPNRAETLPPTIESGPSLLLPAQLKAMIEASNEQAHFLLLDLRVNQLYAQSRIEGALNLCIPTTLLKRATYNLEKLQQTFRSSADQERFSQWRTAHSLVVYDAFSSEKRDAVTCMNMIKKFTNEGYKGATYILRGGFNGFAAEYPEFIDDEDGAGRGGSSLFPANQGGTKSDVAPVIGGVMLPTTDTNPNPFFSNIRQNMDLADGVGQLDIARPSGLESPVLPRWLREASKVSDHGKVVSEKFLHIEQEEQSRMKKAFSLFGQGTKTQESDRIQLCGVEQGVRNRYKDILPFEHSRVKLVGRPEGACDYVNASHIKASRSNKRYIATQGPLPATFEDFWSVIWDQDVRVIVMLTAESEGGQLKCHPYWQGRDFGSIRLRLLSEKKVSLEIDKHRSNSHAPGNSSTATASPESGRRRANTTLEASAPTPQQLAGPGESPYVIIRKFALSHAAQPFAPIREITHLHYPSWPDFGAPAQPSHLLALVELANVMQRSALPLDTPSITASRASPEPLGMTWYDEPEADSRARPMLVHCSAGCGRTGTFCTVDSVIDMLKRQRLVRTMLQPIRKRDSDGDIKMSVEQQEAVSPHSVPKQPPLSATPPTRRTSADARRGSADGPPLDTSWLSDETVDLISRTVEDFRRQRLSMVQSLRQFVLCYESIMEYVWRSHDKGNGAAGGKGRARSGSLQVRREV